MITKYLFLLAKHTYVFQRSLKICYTTVVNDIVYFHHAKKYVNFEHYKYQLFKQKVITRQKCKQKRIRSVAAFEKHRAYLWKLA
jgi:hypothetical protein